MAMLLALLAVQTSSATAPWVDSVYSISPSVLAIRIQAGEVVPSALSRYMAQPGDEIEPRMDGGKVVQKILRRGGQEIGWLIGPKRDWLVTYERFRGTPLDGPLADDPSSYRISTIDTTTLRATKVFRKSKPDDWVQPTREFAMVHTVYLDLPRPMKPQETLRIDLSRLGVQPSVTTFHFDPDRQPSEAVHVSQIGYRPDDPVKCGYLSVWLGTGGAYRYPQGLGFRVIDQSSRIPVFAGKVALAKDASEPEAMFQNQNYNKTSVYRMDFSALKRPGRYVVAVDGVGTSLPFAIGGDVWGRAFRVQMKGLYNERSGVELGPPYTAFRKPRDLHPADGQKVYQSTWSVLEKNEAFAELESHATNQLVPEAWGGYHDAGDWNPRRASHLRSTMASLELFDLFPAYYRSLDLSIPKAKGLPDVLTEALFEIDLFRRLQKPDGSVPYGIETNGDPIEGEVSWLQSMTEYVYAPDPWASYLFASSAARVSRLLEPYDQALAKTYRQCALKAMNWAEADRSRRRASGTWSKLQSDVTDDRNLAAIELYRLTRDTHWRDLFLEDSCLRDPKASLFEYQVRNQRDSAFAYTQLPRSLSDPELRMNAVRAIRADADGALEYSKGNAYGVTITDKGRPMILGFFSVPDAVQVCRAHRLTGDPKYLAGAVQACQFPGGANPMNMTYTVGVGSNWPKHPLHLDSRRTGQPAPLGLTVYGNLDSSFLKDQQWAVWPVSGYLAKVCVPNGWDWPVPEAYWDILLDPAVNEFTVDMWAPNIYVWGYLAARPPVLRKVAASRAESP